MRLPPSPRDPFRNSYIGSVLHNDQLARYCTLPIEKSISFGRGMIPYHMIPFGRRFSVA